jgi:hypothetical protein
MEESSDGNENSWKVLRARWSEQRYIYHKRIRILLK